ncbi:Uncharacterised protein [Vibrio cholerae]|nr:Uncharacterised protein [Vibrio cholerae]
MRDALTLAAKDWFCSSRLKLECILLLAVLDWFCSSSIMAWIS